MRIFLGGLLAASLGAAAADASAAGVLQDATSAAPDGHANPAPLPEQLAWYGTLDSARKEAARTERPIFLLAARPCAREVPGFW